jgi:phenylpropionate dioxygenase-like ring-hydroxylating dioxygenase large terminal subunit
MSDPATAGNDPYASSGVPELGFRNYWYPILASWRLGRKPKTVTLLGEDIVLFRDGGKIHALHDQCAHRRVKLSNGKCLYPGSGTITCPYHGWTYSGETGRVVAKLLEGPDAPIPASAKVKVYPVRELAGVIFVFVGDMEAVPLEDDLPEYLSNQKDWHCISTWRTYQCNWRVMVDNLSYDQHAPFLHRNSPELYLQPIFKHATRNFSAPLENGKGIGYRTEGGITAAVYPGLGAFPPPQESWRRILKPTGRGKDIDPENSPAVKKYGIKYRHMMVLPSMALIGRPSGDYFVCRWVVPIDDKTMLLYTFNLFRRSGPLRFLGDWGLWLVWNSWAHDWIFSEEDKWIVETVNPKGKELLSRTDIGVTAWRRYSVTNARRPAAEAAPATAAAE